MLRFPIDDDTELRLLEERHADELFALVDRNRAYLREWLPWLDATAMVEDERSFVRTSLEGFAAGTTIEFAIWHRGRISGGIGLHFIDEVNRSGEIGYWVSEDLQGRGLVTRACGAVQDHAFGNLGLNRVVMRVDVGNIRSRAIPERLGFTQEGVTRQSDWLYTRFRDMVLYSILAGEWKRSNGGVTSG